MLILKTLIFPPQIWKTIMFFLILFWKIAILDKEINLFFQFLVAKNSYFWASTNEARNPCFILAEINKSCDFFDFFFAKIANFGPPMLDFQNHVFGKSFQKNRNFLKHF